MSTWHRVIHPITEHFRRARGRFLLQQFPDLQQMRICDLGGSRHFWDKIGLPVPPRNITIYNISSSETQSASSDSSTGAIEVRLYDGKRIPVPDQSFDLLICNSVLEHVPPAQRASLCREMERVARNIFCQTPAYEFLIEPHFIMPFMHWLPRQWGFVLARISPWRILARPDHATLHSYYWDTQLLTRAEVTALFPRLSIESEKFLGVPKSYYAIKR